MSEKNLFNFFCECANEKHVEEKAILDLFKKALEEVMKKKFGEFYDNSHFDISVNENDIQILHYKDIVANAEAISENINLIGLSAAKKIEKDFCIGEQVAETLSFNIFTRKEVSLLKKNIINGISFLTQQSLYEKYSKLVGEIIDVQVYQYCRGYIIVHDSMQNELFLPYAEQIPGERLRKKTYIKAIVIGIDSRRGKFVITLSRIGNIFLKKLLEISIPEITDGLVVIKKIARIPGERSKVVVESVDSHIDPIGACVGINCSRLNGLLRELNGEIIDFVSYSENKSVFIANVLGIKEIKDSKNFKNCLFVYVDKEDIGLAFGKNKVNVRLLELLLDQEVKVFEYTENNNDSVVIEVLSEYIDSWIIAEMKENGFLTVQDVIKTSKKDFEEKTDLEEETVDEIYDIINEKILKHD